MKVLSTKSTTFHHSTVVRLTCVAAAVTSSLVLLGWAFNLESLKRILPTLVAMNPVTALGFVLLSITLWLSQSEHLPKQTFLIAKLCAALITLLGLLKLSEILFGWPAGVDQWLFPNKLVFDATGQPNRMAPNTALNFLLLGCALFFLDKKVWHLFYISEALVFMAIFASLLPLLGYLYDTKAAYGIGSFIPMALHTAFLFLIVSIGILFVRPRRGILVRVLEPGISGVMMRRLLPGVIGLPILLGWLRLEGQHRNLYSNEIGVVLMVMAHILLFTIFIWWNSFLLFRLDSKRRQAEMRQQELILELGEKNQALGVARDQALEGSRLKSDFLSMMSHEIRTPMNSVIGMSELLVGTTLDEEQQSYAVTVLEEAEHLLTIINDILDFSKIEAGRLQIENLDFAPRQVVESITEALAVKAGAKQLALMSFVDPDVPMTVRGDSGRLRQILLNLMNNAIKFTDKGEIVVRLMVEAATETHLTLRCMVTDTGIGLAPATQQRLFQPFMQADSSTTRQYGGTGLGLAISSQLVTLMNGTIGIESEVGQGATFWFTILVEHASAAVANTPSQPVALAGVRVLVVDDNATHRHIFQTYLCAWGMVVDVTAQGSEGLLQLYRAAALNTPYAIALIDCQMPDIDGMSFVQHVGNEPLLAATRLIMITAFDKQGQGKQALAAGCAAYLTKPTRQARLLETLTQVMSATPDPDADTRIAGMKGSKPSEMAQM